MAFTYNTRAFKDTAGNYKVTNDWCKTISNPISNDYPWFLKKQKPDSLFTPEAKYMLLMLAH